MHCYFCAQLRKYLLRPSCMIYHQQHQCHGQSINLVSIRLPLLMHKDNELLCRPPLFNTSVSPSPLHTPRRQPQRPTAGMTCPRSTPAYAIELDQSSDEEPEAYICSSRKKTKTGECNVEGKTPGSYRKQRYNNLYIPFRGLYCLVCPV